jgi:glycosyltransferase involved in cell wall biosynthesis
MPVNMKILQIVHSLPFLNKAGTEIYTYELSLELSKKHELYIFARGCDEKQKEYEITEPDASGIKICLINNTFKHCDSFKKYYQNEAIDAKFEALLDRIKPDIVHIQHLVFLSIGIIKKIKDRGIPLVFTIHDYWLMCPRWHILKKDLTPCGNAFIHNFNMECLNCMAELLNIKKSSKAVYLFSKRILPVFLLRWLKNTYFLCTRKIQTNDSGLVKLRERDSSIKVLLNNVSLFLTPSEYLRNKFIKFGIPADKIRLLQNGLNDDLFSDIRKTDSVKIRFGFIGTILPAKGLDVLIKAFNRIRKKDVELKIYGSLYSYADFEDYPFYLKKIAKNKNIKFMGGFNHSEIAGVFREIDVLIVPSIWHENSPLVINEAFLSNTPVIASNIGGIPELVRDGFNGFLFKPGDPLDLQEKIEYIMDNLEIVSELRKNMLKIKTIKENAKELEELYGDLTKSS